MSAPRARRNGLIHDIADRNVYPTAVACQKQRSRQAQGMLGGSLKLPRKLGAIADDREANDLPSAGAIGRRRGRLLTGTSTGTGASLWRRRGLNATLNRGAHHRATNTTAARRAGRSRTSAARSTNWGAIAHATAAATAAMVSKQAMAATAAAAAVIRIATAPTITSARTTMTAVATVTGHGLAVTAHQGDADNREENRDAKNQCSIHPRILQTSNLA
jgi:hypothetical protein